MSKPSGINLKSENRMNLWNEFITINDIHHIAEIGVFKGEFAEFVLSSNEKIKSYYMIDPWRNLSNWNKPLNKSNLEFNIIYQEALVRTETWSKKRNILRGKSSDVMNKIGDDVLDFVYIDADHTLRGIMIDLIKSWPKVKNDGFIAGDDFCNSIWQHEGDFEPTLVFPVAIYFAEAMDVKIYALPHNQFLIDKKKKGFEFINLSQYNYDEESLLSQLNGRELHGRRKNKTDKILRFFTKKRC